MHDFPLTIALAENTILFLEGILINHLWSYNFPFCQNLKASRDDYMKAVKITVLLLVIVCMLASCSGAAGTKALFLALQENSGLDEIEKQLKRGADVNALDEHGLTPLHYAVAKNMHGDIIKALIKAGSDVNAADSNGRTPLDYSGSSTMNSIILIEAGADVTHIDDARKQALLFDAIDASYPDTISILIESGIDINKEYNYVGKEKESYIRWTPLQYAVENSASIEVIMALINAGADVNLGNLLVKARDVETLTTLIKAGADAKIGHPLAQLVSEENATKEMVAALIEAGADVNRGTPLGRAKDIEILKVLLEAGANVNVGQPLRSLATNTTSSSEMIAAMIEAGADVNLGDPLLAAIKYQEDPGIIVTLIKAGADVNTKDQYEGTLLTMAIRNNLADEVIFALIEAGADVEGTPLFLAMELKDMNLISALLEAGADVNAGNFAGWRSNPIGERGWGWDVREMTPLMRAIEVDASLEIISTLIKSGARVNAVDSRGWSPLVYAASSISDPRVISLLLERGAAVNHVYTWDWSSKGLTPLMFAAVRSRTPEIVDALLDGGADAKIVVNGKKAIDYAKENEYLVGTPAYKRLESLSL
jgi:ankyrin repeat protein